MDTKVVKLERKEKGGANMVSATFMKSKPIQATPVIRGEYAKQILSEALREPSQEAIERNKKASDLLKKLRG